MKGWLRPDGLDVLDSIMETGYFLVRNALIDAQNEVSRDALENVRRFFDILAAKYQVSCINLNYDETVDTAVPYLYNGFDLAVENTDGKAFNRRFLLDREHHKIVHLHGSVNYRFPELAGAGLVRMPDANSALRQRGWVNTLKGGIHAGMISGLAKSEKLILPPYNELYHWSAAVLMNVPRVLAIGYGVGDAHLNVWLAQSAIAHGNQYRLCFVTRSNNLDAENQQLQGLLSLAAGYRNVADLESIQEMLDFDRDGYAQFAGLAVLRSGFPRDRDQTRRAAEKIMRFFAH